MKNLDKVVGKIFGSWAPLSIKINDAQDDNNQLYNCNCLKCGIMHIVSKANIISNISCPTCPSKQKSPMTDIIDLFGGMLGLNAEKKNEVAVAFEKLNKPEFQEVYSSLERASVSIKNVMNGNGAPDIAKKTLEVEAIGLKKAFADLIKDGKITEEEARNIKIEVNASENIQKLKSILDVMKQQQSETKKT
jgi:hypothetical protein